MFSVLIATRNRPDALRRCVESVAGQQGISLELIVLDDASVPPIESRSLEEIAGGLPLRLIRVGERLGVGAGRNRLMGEARGEAFVVLDDDAFLTDAGTLARVNEAMERYPEAGLFAFKIRDFRGGRERWLTPHPAWRRADPLLDRPHRVSYYLGGAHAIRRATLARCGAYPERFVYGNEELDLSFRAIEAGFTIQYLPDIVVHHQPAEETPAAPSEVQLRLYHHVRSRLLIAHAYLPAGRAVLYAAGWLAVYGVRALRIGGVGAYVRALVDAWRTAKATPRRPLGPASVAYLRAHFGRLWR
jgi:hypothetical protein